MTLACFGEKTGDEAEQHNCELPAAQPTRLGEEVMHPWLGVATATEQFADVL